MTPFSVQGKLFIINITNFFYKEPETNLYET